MIVDSIFRRDVFHFRSSDNNDCLVERNEDETSNFGNVFDFCRKIRRVTRDPHFFKSWQETFQGYPKIRCIYMRADLIDQVSWHDSRHVSRTWHFHWKYSWSYTIKICMIFNSPDIPTNSKSFVLLISLDSYCVKSWYRKGWRITILWTSWIRKIIDKMMRDTIHTYIEYFSIWRPRYEYS